MNDRKLRAAIAENPVLVLLLGACPAMALTNAVIPALCIGVTVMLVMALSGLIVSLLRRTIPRRVRFAAAILIIAGVTSVVQLLMNAWLPGAFNSLGVYLTLIAVDLLVFSGVERAAERTPGAALADAVLTGLAFTAALLVMAAVRELFGSGSFAGLEVAFLKAHSIPLLSTAPGGFVVLAILIAVINAVGGKERACASGTAAAAAGICCCGAEKED